MQINKDLQLFDEIIKYKNDKNITFFGSARIDCENIENLAYQLAKKGHNIITGGGPGVMKNANYGAYLAKQDGADIKSIGINIKLPFEQHPNHYCDKVFLFENLFLRKQALLELSDIFIIASGGFGTLDELFEIFTLAQTKLKQNAKIIVFNEDDFYNGLFDFFDDLAKSGVIDDESFKLFKIAKNIDETIKIIG